MTDPGTGVQSYIHKHDNLLKDQISKGEPLGSTRT